ncbi:MAG: recombinase family protein [Pasteurella oralis]|nr:recombinase family protein [Pasteurella oralis]
MLNYIRERDVVVVTRVDRLGRSLSQCLKVFDVLRKKCRVYCLRTRH